MYDLALTEASSAFALFDFILDSGNFRHRGKRNQKQQEQEMPFAHL